MSESSTFDWSDYLGFSIVLSISTIIGIYFGCFGSKQKTTEEYLHGGRRMSPFPIALSLVATYIAGLTFVFVPSEIFTQNAIYILCCPAMIPGLLLCYYLFIPVFFDLNISDSYEYLELRFSKTTRQVASGIYVLSSLLYLPFTIYVPALAFSQVTGIDVYIISCGVTIVCIFYTAIGGLKAFVWSDFVQTIILILVTIIIVIIGTADAGGFQYVFTVASKGRRLEIFNMSPDPLIRYTFWNVTISTIADTLLAVVAQQDSIQRIKSVPSMNDVKKVLIIKWFGVTSVMAICVYCGVLVYAVYFGCDPIQKDMIEEADQVFPYFILDKLGYLPLITGIFVAGVMCGGLSSLAAVLNTLAGSLYHHCLKSRFDSDKWEFICMRTIVVILGVYAVVTIPIIANMGTIFAALCTVDSITAAPCLSFFMLGILTPGCNAYGALSGAAVSMILMTWMTIGSAVTGVNIPSAPIYPGVPNTCNATIYDTPFNFTVDSHTISNHEDVFPLYRLSIMYYSTFGTTVNIIVALIVSYFTGGTDLKKLNPKLISPPLRRFLPKPETAPAVVQNHTELKVLTNENHTAKAERS